MTDELKLCVHDNWEMHVAAGADGLCPLCLQQQVTDLRTGVRVLREALEKMSCTCGIGVLAFKKLHHAECSRLISLEAVASTAKLVKEGE